MARLGNRLWQSSSHTSNICWQWGAHVIMFWSTLAQNSQLKSKLVNSFLSRLSKTMLPLSPKPGQDHPKAQQQRKLTSTSPSQGLRFPQLKRKHISGFLLPLLIMEGPLTNMVRAYQDLPKGALKTQIPFFSLTCFY